jgi:hypothetical protein
MVNLRLPNLAKVLLTAASTLQSLTGLRRVGSSGSNAMGAASQIGNSSITALRDVLVIQTMLEDLQRSVRILDCDIATEEAAGRIGDAADPRYPLLAKTLSTRRDNLKSTIRALKERLGQLTAMA